MPDQSVPPIPPQPPPVPAQRPPGIPYAGPAPRQPAQAEPDVQRVFDTVVGPNVRLIDNLVQLACVVIGGAVGAGVGWMIADPSDGSAYPLIGGVLGVIGGLVLSGAVIGIIRGRNALRRRP